MFAVNTLPVVFCRLLLNSLTTRVACGVRGKMSIPPFAVINADFRLGEQALVAYKCDDSDDVVCVDSTEAFVPVLVKLHASGRRIYHYSGAKYIFGRMLDGCGKEAYDTVKAIAADTYDINVCFYTDKGYLAKKDRMEVYDTDTIRRYYPCMHGQRDLSHEAVLKHLTCMVRTLQRMKGCVTYSRKYPLIVVVDSTISS